jgi:REP element-mobilizing transposase RayT
MTSNHAIYEPNNVHVAYQLNWSLTVFTRMALPAPAPGLEAVRSAVERDGVRILEYRARSPTTHQFLLSTHPGIAPQEVIRSVKGRWQHALRSTIPKMFKRNYRLDSVGEANNNMLQSYVDGQAQRHAVADDRIQRFITSCQFFDADVDLGELQRSAHGQYIANLHLVFENRQRLSETREEGLCRTRDALIRAARKEGYRLARIGIVCNHVHLLMGCGLTETPLAIALSLMNDVAYAHDRTHYFEYSFYVGTFGNYDRDAIRRWFVGQDGR